MSDKALDLAKDVAKDITRPWFLLFDNINIYVKKHHNQRLDNQNDMINATNCAIVRFPPSVDPSVFDRKHWLSLQGKRSDFDLSSLQLSDDDDVYMSTCFDALIAKLVVDYCPGKNDWSGMDGIRKTVYAKLPSDRPLEVTKTETAPFGVINVNEGSKLGCIEVFSESGKTLNLTPDFLSERILASGGDYLSSRNTRMGRNERQDDLPHFHTLEYVHPISQLFHFDMNATKSVLNTHAINAMNDAGSLSRQKDVLHRSFDINNAPHADAKALVFHSLVSRVFCCLM